MRELPAWIEGARGAPSAHNTQPWRFVLASDDRVLVRWDPDRSLPAGDPTGRDLFLSLGAAVEGARLCAAAAGVRLAFEPSSDEAAECTVGWLAPGDGAPDPADVRLARSLRERHTARTPHLRTPVQRGVQERLQAEAAASRCRLHIVSGPREIRQLAGLARQATAAQFADASVHAELWRWLRLDSDAPAYHRDGLTADCLNLEGATLAIARYAMPPHRMRRLVRANAHHLLALDTQLVVRRSASICLLTAPAHDRITLLRAGELLLRLWLIAAEEGLSTHPVSALLDCADTVQPAAAVFSAAQGIPTAVFRLGKCPPVARAPRLPVEELVEVTEGMEVTP